ncbi:YbbR-like domain-containing protein [Ectobacillus sp. sgz5001026]|uniref:CdaR family protein n=1 Tax=Ectobacillus sp. sgz5001026 TaxID=3242473 RepID=UPI0036D2A371
MDKWMDNTWFLKGISLLLAFMLFMATGLEKQSTSSSILSTGLPFGDTTETIQNVDVTAQYDQDKYVITGLPKTVSITLEGQSGLITAAKISKQYQVEANLKGYEPGTYDVNLEYHNISEDLKVKIVPSKVRVTIADKVKKQFPVEVGFLNSDQVKGNFDADKVSVKPNTIEIAGTQEQLNQVSLVKVYVDLNGLSQTVTKEAKIGVYDKNGNQMDVQTNPSVVNVTVPISSPEKQVPIQISRKGTLAQGITITSITTDPQVVTLYGPQNVLDTIDSINGVVVDLDKISSNTTYDADVVLPPGVLKASPSKVKVAIQIQKQETKSLSDVSLQVLGLATTYNMNFIDPASGKVGVDVVGDPSIVDKLSSSQIQASLSLQNLVPGTYDVPVQINNPTNVTLVLKQKSAKVEIVKKS